METCCLIDGFPHHPAQLFTTRPLSGFYGHGTLRLLTAPSLNSLAPSITLAGQQISSSGSMTGPLALQTVPVKHIRLAGVQTSQYIVQLPAAAAAVVVMQRKP